MSESDRSLSGTAQLVSAFSNGRRLSKDTQNMVGQGVSNDLEACNRVMEDSGTAQRLERVSRYADALSNGGLDSNDPSLKAVENGRVVENEDGSWSAVTHLDDEVEDLSLLEQEAILNEVERRSSR